MNKPSEIHSRVRNAIDSRKKELRQISQRLHDNPETAMKEHQAVQWLSSFLESSGFSIETGIAGMATAFRACAGSTRPVIAFIAEYDALPELGHACGHNLIATAAAAAAIGAMKASEVLGGSIQVIGTPAEELQGGKIGMVEAGVFDRLDAAMMLHPAAHDSATVRTLACISLDAEFFGRESHAAGHPELGINALEAMILAFNGVDSLRQHISTDARIHGIITDGGRAANIVPGHSAARFLVRAAASGYIEILKKKVISCFQGAALSTGARLEYHWNADQFYQPMRNDEKLARLYIANMALLGHPVPFFNEAQSFGSTDMGNISQRVPAIHTSVAIAPPGTSEHTPEFARYASQDSSFEAVILAATAMAYTAIDLLADPGILQGVSEGFNSV
jgi:amidohydrolase